MLIFWICLSVFVILVGSFTPKDYEDKIMMFFTNIICTLGLALCVYSLAYEKGIEDGAYNQLRHKYEVTYVIDKDSCVVDTVINLKGE